MNAIARAIDALNEGFGRLIAPLLAVITLIVVYDIAMRFFIGRPSDWAFDVTKMLFGAHFMLMAAYGLRHHAHVEVDVLKRLLSRRKQAALEILGYLIFFVPFIWMLLTYGWSFFERSFSRSETTYGIVALPVYPVKAVIVVTAVLILLQAIAIVIRAIQELRKEEAA
ncbi:TRAP transporter small permease subunit [Halomonas elongata]|uniref:TRAP transporter small permease protein n=1 Tax=Halomonas elongata (strain ATCC 33173 / DSM 2581 / NBRC 15536 / NCIMB 2198 / 1H9) TaxID=768066 RepID=E1V9Z3_HALED|nr:TRAP transporter small permease subunit [Halomonas elongata]WBF17620.1 TRAP transporter small permease subunit [Halomonas elongata]WPU46459.1 TRAP transporter small permease subunit [Halomonas elongata DSM 2581]WVI71251.1 TRAP transporter small permease subunit [Halomonas elongata]CBV43881.1 TRAP transporter small transmembrane protein [Halomonas elongata DSM 2581]